MQDIAAYLLPALMVFIATYLVIHRFFKNEDLKRQHQLQRSNQKIAFPTRLRAYERLVLFVERITPENLIPRVLKGNMPIPQFQALLIKTIREEFEHNLSQQIYVSDEAWNRVCVAKESTIKLINISASTIKSDAGAIEMSKLIFEAYGKAESKPAEDTLKFLKQEAKQIL